MVDECPAATGELVRGPGPSHATARATTEAQAATEPFRVQRRIDAELLDRRPERRFVETRTLAGRHGGRALPVVTLTREGHAFTRQHLASGIQRYHYGLVRPKEQAHDAALYRMALSLGMRQVDGLREDDVKAIV